MFWFYLFLILYFCFFMFHFYCRSVPNLGPKSPQTWMEGFVSAINRIICVYRGCWWHDTRRSQELDDHCFYAKKWLIVGCGKICLIKTLVEVVGLCCLIMLQQNCKWLRAHHQALLVVSTPIWIHRCSSESPIWIWSISSERDNTWPHMPK